MEHDLANRLVNGVKASFDREKQYEKEHGEFPEKRASLEVLKQYGDMISYYNIGELVDCLEKLLAETNQNNYSGAAPLLSRTVQTMKNKLKTKEEEKQNSL